VSTLRLQAFGNNTVNILGSTGGIMHVAEVSDEPLELVHAVGRDYPVEKLSTLRRS